MLVLSRKVNETVELTRLGIVITVVEIAPGKIRLGIQAPKDEPVHRGEVAKVIREQQKAKSV